MKVPAVPANEEARLEALRGYAVLDTDRQWFKSRYGLDVVETARDISFCGHVVESEAALHMKDTFEDDRFADNPLVTGEPKIRFYMGTPLRTADGFVHGTLCVIDRKPRELASEQVEILRLLAHEATAQLELRRRNISLATAIANGGAKVESGAMELTLSTVSLATVVSETVAILEPSLHGRAVRLTPRCPPTSRSSRPTVPG